MCRGSVVSVVDEPILTIFPLSSALLSLPNASYSKSVSSRMPLLTTDRLGRCTHITVPDRVIPPETAVQIALALLVLGDAVLTLATSLKLAAQRPLLPSQHILIKGRRSSQRNHFLIRLAVLSARQ